MLPALLLAVALAVPRAPAQASISVYVPRLDKLSEVTSFMAAAGQYSALLRPGNLRSEFHPLLGVDPTSIDALKAAGIDPTGPATVSLVGGDRVSCVTLKDPKLYAQRASERLSDLGSAWKSKAGGLALFGATIGERVIAGYVLQGRESCAVSSGQGLTVEPTLRSAAALFTAPAAAEWKTITALPGAAFIRTRYASAGLKGDVDHLTAEGRSGRLGLPALRSGGASPYAAVGPSGLALLKLRVDPSGIPALMDQVRAQVHAFCRDCDGAKVQQLTALLQSHLTGNVLLRVESVKVKGSLRTNAARFFAARHAWLAELQGAPEVAHALEALREVPGALKRDEGYVLPSDGEALQVGVHGNHLFFGNDAHAVEEALALLTPKSEGKQSHGAELRVDPKGVARGLAQIGLFDILGSQELAGLFAAGTELGPLLLASDKISAWADSGPDGANRFQATWTLSHPAKP